MSCYRLNAREESKPIKLSWWERHTLRKLSRDGWVTVLDSFAIKRLHQLGLIKYEWGDDSGWNAKVTDQGHLYLLREMARKVTIDWSQVERRLQ